MRGPCRAILDASVLYPASLRNLLMRLALRGLFQPRWSHQIHEEWIRAVLRDRPDLSAHKLYSVRDLMDRHAEDAIASGYEPLIPSLTLPDPDDRHVLAAAIVAGADVIVTRNLRHFPSGELGRFEIEAQHPDAFVRSLLDLAPISVAEAVRDQQRQFKNPPISMPELLATFERVGLAETAAVLRHLFERRS